MSCSHEDLVSICKEYGISTIQKNRFIQAIQKLPNAQSIKKEEKAKLILIRPNEQEIIDKMDSLSTHLTQTLTVIQNTRKNNIDKMNSAKLMIEQRCAEMIKRINTLKRQEINKVEQL